MTVFQFVLGYLIVVVLTYAKGQLAARWEPSVWTAFEFSYLLIFLIIRSSSEARALVFTFLLSVGMDFIFQVGLIKGLPCMGQLVLVYLVMKVKRNVVPVHQDLFLIIFFAFFYVLNYYIYNMLNNLLGADLFTYQTMSIPMLVILTMLHTALFALVLLGDIRYFRRSDS